MTVIIIIVSGLVIVAVAAQALFLSRRQEHGEHFFSGGVGEAMLGVVGTLFSVLLGLLVAGAIERYMGIMVQAEAEANGVGNIFRLAKGLREQDRVRLRSLCREYVDFVLKDEWALMENQRFSDQAMDRYNRLWEACVSVSPQGDRESNIHQAVLDNMDSVGENRRARIISSESQMPTTLWAAIICGSAITVAFTYLFTIRLGHTFNWMLTGIVAVSLGLNIWLLAAYSTPFSGDLQIQPKGFELLQRSIFDRRDDQARYITPQEQDSYAKQAR